MKRELLKIIEHPNASYKPRTEHNARKGDVTLAIATDMTTAGEMLTKKLAGDKYIGFKIDGFYFKEFDVSKELYHKLKNCNGKILNVAGNGIYTLIKSDVNQREINQIVFNIISQVHYFYPLDMIITGGQTGVDIAGAVAGYALEIPTEVTLPHGYKQRFEGGFDIDGNEEKVYEQIHNGVLKLQPYEVIFKSGSVKKHTIKP